MAGYVRNQFIHRWKWNSTEYSSPPVTIRDLIKARLAEQGYIFTYNRTQVYTNRTSDAYYARLEGDYDVQLIKLIAVALIASVVAGVITAAATAYKIYKSGGGVAFEIGLTGIKWYANTSDHQIISDDGTKVDIPEGGGGSSGGDSSGGGSSGGGTSTQQNSSSVWYIAAVLAGVFLVFVILK